MAITLSPELEKLVQDKIASGEYSSPDEVVKAGLALLENQQSKIEALRNALIAGEQSGPLVDFDIEEFIGQKHKEL